MFVAQFPQASERGALEATQQTWADACRQTLLLAHLGISHGAALSTRAVETASLAASGAALAAKMLSPDAGAAWTAYLEDFGQRLVLSLDTLRLRGDACAARASGDARPVLCFDYETVLDGRTFDRPVNYALLRIASPTPVAEDGEEGRPWVIIDPRAGQGSGIGGFKPDSEVGVALRGGHPVYFVMFFPQPEPGQTLADVCAAEAQFLREVQARHPQSPKPLVTGNCQGGWATMVLAATHPELMGPVVIAGSPLAYWSGEIGCNPFRYFGGIAGGGVPAALACDLGAGLFDGADLILNFIQLNPGKTLFRKNFDLFSQVDEEAGRFLEFERWWSHFYFMNANEIRWIVEELFIGDRLARGEASLPGGAPIDLARIEAPVVVFASHGDNIPPPQQALNWIPDLYRSEKEIEARGHVIIYTLHDSVGHLGIFVSGQVANRQHEQIGAVVATIESLAPGLYEMLIVEEDGATTVDFEARRVADILALGGGRAEEVEFAAAASVSEWLVKTYEIVAQPLVRALVAPSFAQARRALHPLRQERRFYSSENPLFASLGPLADDARRRRARVGDDNPFLQAERRWADLVERAFDAGRDLRDATVEIGFHAIYAAPAMMRVGAARHARPAAHEIARLPHVQEALRRAKSGGYAEGVVRMLILLARARGSVRRDRLERSNALLHARPPFNSMTPESRARIIHEQSTIVEFAGAEAVATLGELLLDPVDRYRALNLVLDVAGPVETMDAATIAMFRRLQGALLTLARHWSDPDLRDETPALPAPEASLAPVKRPGLMHSAMSFLHML